ncbi:hypothetical protein JCM14635_10970 [Megalodesulfovibrio paquesii]
MRLWMLRLLVFLLLTLGGSLVSAIVDRHTGQRTLELEDRSAQRSAVLESVGRLLLEWRDEEELAQLEDYLNEQRKRGLLYALLDSQGELLAGDAPGPELAAVAMTALQANGYAFDDAASGLLPPPPMAPPVLECLAFRSPEGELYALALHRTAPPLFLVRQPRHLTYIVLGALLAMALYYALCRVTRLSGRASQELSSAMRRLAQGDFAARLDPAFATPETPYADLAKDFNRAVTTLADKQAEQRYMLTELAHNMSASLTRLALAVELAGNTSPERAMQLLERIKADSGQLSGITEQLMGCVREEWNECEKKPLALGRLLQQVTHDVNARLGADGKRVVFAATGDGVILGNEAQLASMVRNILSNALRHTPPFTQVLMQLTVEPPDATTASTAPAGQAAGGGEGRPMGKPTAKSMARLMARLEVVDQGPGLPPDMLERVFRPFQQGGGLRGEAGLGLAIARLVCERHGGRITLHNQPEGGLGAVMLLPLQEETPSHSMRRGQPLLHAAAEARAAKREARQARLSF